MRHAMYIKKNKYNISQSFMHYNYIILHYYDVIEKNV